MPTLYVMQGAPGSGKTRVAMALAMMPASRRCSTDDLFVTDGGHYAFDPAKLPEKHAENLRRSVQALKDGFTVIVDNTNIKRWQAREYVRFAVASGTPIVFVRVTGTFTNMHGVPMDRVREMRDGMEDLTVESVLASRCPWETEEKKETA